MTKHVFRLPNGQQMTSLVMDQTEFDKLCQYLDKLKVETPNLEAIRKAKHLPLMTQSTTTELIFRTYGVKTEFLSAIVRGQGQEIIKELDQKQDTTTIISDQEFRQHCEEIYTSLSIELQQDINATVDKLVEAAKQQTQAESCIINFISKHGKELPRNIRINLAEHSIAALYQTYFIMKHSTNNFDEEFKGYLKRLLIGIAQTCRINEN
jgi:hypothetical protein